MGTITILQVCNAIATTLDAAIPTLTRVQSMDQLTEDYPSGDLPLLQVYWTGHSVDPSSVNNDRHTFRKGVVVTVMDINVDLIATQRHELMQDMTVVAGFSELLDAALTAQGMPGVGGLFFGLDGIKGMAYRQEYVTFQRGTTEGGGLTYPGIRALLQVRIF